MYLCKLRSVYLLNSCKSRNSLLYIYIKTNTRNFNIVNNEKGEEE